MDLQALKETANAMMDYKKGLLAMDESTPTCNKRFKTLNIPQTIEYRQKYRQLIVTTDGLEKYISGAILFDETIKQTTADGRLFIDILQEKGIIPGIKVDAGTVAMPGHPDEKITEGLDGLRGRLQQYYALGARFAKWRAVISIGNDMPTSTANAANANALALYAAMCQEEGLVPIVEPEVVMDGSHGLQKCAEVTTLVLHTVFETLYQYNVNFEGLILKPNMVLPGDESHERPSADKVAEATVNTLLKTVPAIVPGIAFLSGGQPAEKASVRLNTMHVNYGHILPWQLTYSFSRAIQQPALDIWKGNDKNIAKAQKALLHRAACNAAARQGKYTPDMEKNR